MIKSKLWKKGFYLIYDSRQEVCIDGGGMAAGGQSKKKLADHVSINTQEAELVRWK